MNSNSFTSATQSLLNSPNRPIISSLPSNTLFKFNTNHLNLSIQPPNITIKASATRSFTPEPENETLYDVLGIPETVTLSEIKHAYKKMTLKYHPDVSPPNRVREYTVRFIRVQEAYDTLSDPEARFMYDSCITCMAKGFDFSGKRETQVDHPKSDDKKRWKETWMGQISELQQQSTRVDKARGMSRAAQIRKQQNQACVNGSEPV